MTQNHRSVIPSESDLNFNDHREYKIGSTPVVGIQKIPRETLDSPNFFSAKGMTTDEVVRKVSK